jgi:hypothetical protein
MTARHVLSVPVDYSDIDDQLMSLWRHAVHLQLEHRDWESIAHAWMDVVRACPINALHDRAIFSEMAGYAARKARRWRKLSKIFSFWKS